MKKCFLLFSIILIFNNLSRAQNLVPNPSFENYFNTFCGIMESSDFNLTMMDWRNPTFGSTDVYFTNISQSCYNFQPDSQYSGPIGIKGTQLPRTGDVMAGIWVYTIDGLNQREYLQIQLETPMTVGKAYAVSYYVSLADYTESSINSLGAYFSEVPIAASNEAPLDFEPQILVDDFITDVSNWTLISDTIIADADFKYLTIGNFYNDDSTNIQANATASGEIGTYGAYYFVDDVSVEEIELTNIRELGKMEAEIFPNPVNNEINISLPEDETELFISIFDAQGMEVFSSTISDQNTFKIDCSKFSKGVYFVHLNNQRSYLTQKIVKF